MELNKTQGDVLERKMKKQLIAPKLMKVGEEGPISVRFVADNDASNEPRAFCLNLGKAQPIMRGTFFPGSRGRASVYNRFHCLMPIKAS